MREIIPRIVPGRPRISLFGLIVAVTIIAIPAVRNVAIPILVAMSAYYLIERIEKRNAQ